MLYRFVWSVILLLGLCSPAAAQLAPPAPVRQNVDANGVDLFLGRFNISSPALTIGQGDPQGFSYYQLNKGEGWADNISVALNLSGSTMTVSLGGTSDKFTVSGSSYVPTQGNSATLTYNSGTQVYTYTRADGTVAHLAKTRLSTYPYYANEGRVTDIAFPSGAKLVFSYDSLTYCKAWKQLSSDWQCISTTKAYRLANVKANYGYLLGFNYGEIPDFNINDPSDQPDFQTWSTPLGTTVSNLAKTSSATASRTSDYVTISGQAYFVVTDALSRQTKFRMSGVQVAGITLPDSTTEAVSIAYIDPVLDPRVSSVTSAPGTSLAATTSYAYSDSGSVRTTTVTDPLGHAWTYRFDIASQRMTSMTSPSPVSATTAWEYDAQGRVTKITSPEGNRTEYDYQSADRGNITQTRAYPKHCSSLATIVTSASYDASCDYPVSCNHTNSSNDELGKVTNYSYDATHGGVTTVEQPAPSGSGARPTTNYSYTALQAYYKNGSGSIVASGETVYKLTGTTTCPSASTCAGSVNEVKTSIDYGPQVSGTGNNLLPVSTAKGSGDGTLTAITSYSYDDIGNVTYVDGPLPDNTDVTRLLYDAARQQIGIIGPDPDGAGAKPNRATRITYNGKGQVTKSERGTTNGQSDSAWSAFSAAERVEIGYDAANRQSIATLIAGSTAYAVTQYSYLANNLPDCVAVRMNPSVFSSIAGTSACTLGTTGTQGPDRITQTAYDNADRARVTREALGVTGQQRDSATVTYTGNGNVATLADAKGNLTSYDYDDFTRPTFQHYPSTTTPETSSPTDYDGAVYNCSASHCDNLVTTFRMRNGSLIGFGYDDLSRLTFKDIPGTEPDVSYGYDLLGRLTSASQPGNALSFTFDALGRNLTQAGPLGTVTSTWDLAGRRTRLDLPGGFFTTFHPMVTGEIWSIRESGAASGPGVTNIDYDGLGRRISLSRGNGTVTGYAYDPVSRLAQLSQDLAGTGSDLTLGYSYSAASQIVQRTSSNDAYAMRQQWNASRAYASNALNQYTTAGKEQPTYNPRGNLVTLGPWSYTYVPENMMKSAASASAGTTSLSYDPAMRLYEVSGTATTRFLYDGADLVAEYDGAGNVLRRYVHGPSTDEVITWYEGAGTGDRRWLHADERGSVIAVSDGGGNAIRINAYDEWGNPQSGNLGRFGYTGQTWLAEIGLWYYKARMYNARLGRFMQADPIGYQGGMNLYAYVGGDPINATDPAGLRAESPMTGSIIPGVDTGAVSYGASFQCLNCGRPDFSHSDGQGGLVATSYKWGWVSNNAGLPVGGLGPVLGMPREREDTETARQNMQRNGQKPPSHDEGDPDYNRDLNKCRALADAGNRAAASRCYSSAETRKGLRDGGTPEGALPPLITWRTPAAPVPGPSAPNPWVTGGVIVGGAAVACVIFEPCGAAALGVLGLGSLGLIGAQ